MGGNTTGAWDNTAAPEIQEAARLYIKAEKAKGNPLFANRTHLDQDGSCLIEDLGGHACPGNSCHYAHPGPDGTKSKIGPDYVSHKHLDKPIPGLPIAAAAKARAPKKRRPAPRKRPARKAKAGRRRR